MDILTLPILLRYVGALLVTLCLMLAGLYMLQNLQGRLRTSGPLRRLKKLETLALTRTVQIHLVEVDDQPFLLTTGPQSSHLHPVAPLPKAKPVGTPIPAKPKK